MKKEKAKDKAKTADQPNLFGEQDQVYNAIQEEISIVVDAIKGCQDTISKKEEQAVDLQKRKDSLEKAAATVAKYRDRALLNKGKKEKKE